MKREKKKIPKNQEKYAEKITPKASWSNNVDSCKLNEK